jgi:hypothetical protein
MNHRKTIPPRKSKSAGDFVRKSAGNTTKSAPGFFRQFNRHAFPGGVHFQF